MLEVELLDAGLLQRLCDADGREMPCIADAGIAVPVQTLRRDRAARDAHEALVGCLD
jgi:hypothetical protein